MRMPGAWFCAPKFWRVEPKTFRHKLAVFTHRFICRASAGVLLFGTNTYAAVPPQDLPTVQQRQDDIQRRFDEQIRREQELRRAPIDQPPDGLTVPRQEAPVGLPEGECRDFANIEVTGVEILSADESADLVEPFADACLGLPQFDEVLREVSNWYLDRGYVTTRAYLPPQDLNTGILRVVVVEGKVEAVRLEGDADPRGALAAAFPGVVGKILNIRDLEQGLDQINRVPSNTAKMDLLPGETKGGSVVEIKNQPAKRWRLSLTMDNGGSVSTGRLQRSLGLALDNPLGLGDTWTLSVRPDAPGEQVSGTRTASGSVTVPYGYWTFGYNQSWSTYYDVIEGQAATYRSDGISRAHTATVERVVHRNADSKTSVEAKLTAKQTRNYIEHVMLAVQSRKLSIGALTLRHATKVGGGALNVSAVHEWGLRTLGAQKDHTAPTGPSAQFSKWSGDVSFAKPFQVAEQNLRVDVSGHGQWTPDTLFSSERISVGGQYTVRGFRDQSASGDVGGYARAQLSWILPVTGHAGIDKVFGRFTPYAGADAGFIRRDYSETHENGALSGVALGLRTGGGIAAFDVAYARPLAQPGHITTGGGEVYAKLTLTY